MCRVEKAFVPTKDRPMHLSVKQTQLAFQPSSSLDEEDKYVVLHFVNLI